jgi:hypothetical protein
MLKTSTTLAAATLLATPALGDHHDPAPPQLIQAIGQAHGQSAYDNHAGVRADFSVTFGQRDPFAGTMTFDTAMSRVHMQLTTGVTVVFDGHTAWVSPADVDDMPPSYRFHVLTWPYFLAAPFKLDDPSVNLDPTDGVILDPDHADAPGAFITFGDDAGDTPDDWYYAFANPDDDSLAALGYIVTFGRSADDAEDQPGIILYSEPTTLEGVTFHTRWDFHHWSRDPAQGIGEPKGHATISNLQLLDNLDPTLFTRPDNAREATLPTP